MTRARCPRSARGFARRSRSVGPARLSRPPRVLVSAWVSAVGSATAPPPWDATSSSARLSSDARASPTASPAYDPSAFDEYFAWRPALVLRRALEIALRLGDVGARVYVKRGDIQDRAARLRRHLTALGPAFVKLGQVLSTRADVLPASYCRELAELQDNLPPRPANTPPPS